MPRCSGPCTRQIFETRNQAITKVEHISGEDCVRLSANDPEIVKAFNEAVAKETETIDSCPRGCHCAIFEGQNPPWTEWVTIQISTTAATVADCRYKITGQVDIQSRILNGLCLTEPK